MLVGAGFGFWLGFSFIKKQLPDLTPDVNVNVKQPVNNIEVVVPRQAQLRQRSREEEAQEGAAEFIGEL